MSAKHVLESLLIVLVKVMQTSHHNAIMDEIELVLWESPSLLCIIDFELGAVSAALSGYLGCPDLHIRWNPAKLVSYENQNGT